MTFDQPFGDAREITAVLRVRHPNCRPAGRRRQMVRDVGDRQGRVDPAQLVAKRHRRGRGYRVMHEIGVGKRDAIDQHRTVLEGSSLLRHRRTYHCLAETSGGDRGENFRRHVAAQRRVDLLEPERRMVFRNHSARRLDPANRPVGRHVPRLGADRQDRGNRRSYCTQAFGRCRDAGIEAAVGIGRRGIQGAG